MTSLGIVRDVEQAAVLLQPVRLRMMEALRAPLSAAGLARLFGLPRQQVNYHLRELERAGLVALVEERRKGNCTERVVRATAATFVISPEVRGAGGAMPADRFSAGYLVAAAGRMIREIGEIATRARAAGKTMATLTLESEVRFRTVEERAAFAAEMTEAFGRICAKYDAGEGRSFRFVLGGYPALTVPGAVEEGLAVAVLD